MCEIADELENLIEKYENSQNETVTEAIETVMAHKTDAYNKLVQKLDDLQRKLRELPEAEQAASA